MSLACRSLLVVLAAVLFAVVPQARGAESKSESDAATSARKGPLVLDDPVEPLQAKRDRSEAEQDRLTALSMYGAARMKQQQEELPQALRLYQRAFRLDPKAASVAREVVALALEMGRQEEGMRYAVKAAELEPDDDELIERIALILTQRNDLASARKLYERLAAAKAAAGEPTDYLRQWWIGRLYFLDADFKAAVRVFQEVSDALANPEEHKLDAEVRQRIVHEAARTYELLGDAAAVDKRKKESLALEFFGEAFLAGEAAEAAQEAFARAKQIDGKSPRHAFNEARIQKLKGDHRAALEHIETYLQSSSSANNAEAYDLLADVQNALGQREALLAQLEKLRAERQDDRELRAELAQQYQAAENFEKAVPLYRDMIAGAAQKQGRPPLEAYRALVEIHGKQGDDAALLAVLTEGLALVPSMELFGKEGEQLAADQAAVERLAAAARDKSERDPELAFETAEALAVLALEAKQFALASEFFERAMRAKPDEKADLLRAWGLGLLVSEQYAEAARIFRRGLDEKVVGDDAAEFEFHLAGTLEMSNQTDEALAAAARAAELVEKLHKADDDEQKTSSDAYFRIIAREPWVLYHAKRHDEAATKYNQLIERFDDKGEDEAARRALREARLMLSNLAVLKGNMPQAEEWLEQILDEYPDDISALNDLGYLWAEQGKRLDRSLAMIQQALAGDPDNAAYRDSLGWAYYQLGRHEEAKVELEAAAAADEPDGVILDHLGDVYLKLDQLAKARESWTRAVERFKRDADAEKERATSEKLERHAESANSETPAQ